MEPDAITEHEVPGTKYEEGVALFNRGEFFDAHEVWEELWKECPAAERRFVQALIQAAVAIYHFERGNHAGASRLFHSGRRYMEPYRPTHCGLDVDSFWRTMEAHLAPALAAGAAGPRPVIVLSHPAGSHE
jgi:predicted metal-dependent hydrolase